jgi:hypothetical protein
MEVFLSRKPTTQRLFSLQLASGISFTFQASDFGRPKPRCLRGQPAVYFSRIGITLRGLPHSKQHAFDRDVINPQDGHILCDPYPAIFGSLRSLSSSRIVTDAISRPLEILIAPIYLLLLGDFRIECSASDGHGVVDFAAFHVLIAIQPLKVLSR